MSLRNRNPYHKGIDWTTVLIYVLLVTFGWFNLYAANYNPESPTFFSYDSEYFKQLVWIGVSALCIGFIMLSDSKIFVEASFAVFGFSVLLLLIVLFAGKEVNGAKSWLALGPIQFQPVEFTKIGTALVIARLMSRYGFTFNAKNYANLFGILLVPIALVLLQNDTGSALIFFVFLLPMFREGMSFDVLLVIVVSALAAIATLLTSSEIVMGVALGLSAFVNLIIVLRHGAKREAFNGVGTCALGVAGSWVGFYIAGVSVDFEYLFLIGAATTTLYLIAIAIRKRLQTIWKSLLYLWVGLIVSFGTGFVFENVLIEHQRTRINILFGIEEDPLGAGYNVNQSLIAIGSGGATGKGFLQGTQTKLNFVPKQTTDFIFCTVGEEWGFIGSLVLVSLYLCLFIRLLLLAEKQHSVFSRVFGYCVASIFFFHFTVNICMAIGLMPVIGIPLPFFSYGGSSLWGFSVLLFIFLKLDTGRNELIR